MDEILTCKYSKCKRFLDVPIILPCFNTMCHRHVKELSNNSEFKFIKCEFCKEDHEIPKDGFKNNIDLAKVLDLNQHLNEKQKEAKLSLKYLESLINELFNLSNDPEYYLFEYISDLANKIDLTREKLKERIDLIAQDMLSKIKNLQEECKQNLNKKFNKLNKAEQDNIKNKINEWNEELRIPKLKNQKLDILLDDISLTIRESKMQVKKYKNEIINGKNCVFEHSNKEFSQEDFGLFILRDANDIKLTENTGTCIKTFKAHEDYIRCLNLIDDEKLVTGSRDNSIKIWDLKTLKSLGKLTGHSNAVVCLEVVSGSKLISGSWDKTIKIWDLNTLKCIETLSEHTDIIRDLHLVSRNKLISASDDGTIKIWNINDYKCIDTLYEHSLGVCCLKASNDGELLFSGSLDKTIKIWSMDNFECLKTLEGHTDYVFCFEIMSNGNLISGSNDQTIKIWDIHKGLLNTIKNNAPISCLKLLTDEILVSGNASKSENLKIWDLNLKDCVKILNTNGHSYTVFDLNLLPDGNLISCSGDKLVKIWSI